MAGGTRFVVLCPECALDEMHRDAAPARRMAARHHHPGATVISVSAIAAAASHKGHRDLLGLIFTTTTAQRSGPAAVARKPSHLRDMLGRIA